MQHLLIRNVLDVMHCEKNLSENVIRTLFGQKDTPTSRKDMESQNIREHLWIKEGDQEADGVDQAHASYVLTELEREGVIHILRSLKTPSGYVSTFGRRIDDDGTLHGLKSHDYHVIMQQLLPLCLRNCLQRGPKLALMRLSRVFVKICAKVIDPNGYKALYEEVALTICLLEKEFPPSFFDVMTHLLIHLVEEVDICGPVYGRWMYPMERYMKVLKGYVRNKAKPEGSMGRGYAIEVSLGLCTSYMQNFKSTSRRVWDDMEEDRDNSEILCGSGRKVVLSGNDRDWCHTHVLMNSLCMEPFRR